MREMVLAIRAIWDCWLNGTKLEFRGDFYTHTLMTPFFTPDRGDLAEVGVPRIFLAGVGELMTEVAGEVCDGFICHGFTTERYLREVTLPALAKGRAKAGKTMEGFEIVGPSFVVTGGNEAELAAATTGTRQQIAFYGSTPAYRAVLDLHGWGGLQDELNGLSKQGRWADMGDLIDDEILNTFAVVAEPEAVAPELQRRYGDVIQRISFYAPVPQRPRTLGPDHRRPESRLRPPAPVSSGGQARVSVSSRYCSRHLARCSLPEEVLGRVPGLTSITSRGGMPHTSSVRWWISRPMAARSEPFTSATTTTDSLPL